MDITGRTLREVEFRDRLRGYDTDEVDEFLEKAAVGVDELHAEIARLTEVGQKAPDRSKDDDAPAFDDESIRRTLVLAQRTADLAVKEAQNEAEHLVEDAQARADALLADARETSARIRAEAETELNAMIDRLTRERERLDSQVNNLRGLVETERVRLTDQLASVLTGIEQTLSVSAELSDAVPRSNGSSASRQPVPEEDDPFDLGLPDIEQEIADDAEQAFTRVRETAEFSSSETDDDEELWERWSKSAAELGEDNDEDPFRFGGGPERR